MEQIVVGIDGSEPSMRALAWAVEEAKVHKATLRVVHAWFDPLIGNYFAPPSTAVIAGIEQGARKLLEEAVATIEDEGGALKVEPVLVHGLDSSALLQEAQDADLLVVGSRGRGGFKELLLGSVSHQVTHHATCPVVVVR
jgi:nucleotide-binding universal stress UspA family protein